jgi:hypothetical protein
MALMRAIGRLVVAGRRGAGLPVTRRRKAAAFDARGAGTDPVCHPTPDAPSRLDPAGDPTSSPVGQ